MRGVEVPIEIYRIVAPAESPEIGSRAALPGRVAVLPFASISPDPRDEYIADGLTQEMISTLSQLGGLRVIARTSVDVYKTRSRTVPQIGAELNVRSLLEGSVRRVGNKVRVTVQLIDVATQEPLWVGAYDRDLGDVLAVQGEIAAKVAEILQVKVMDQEKLRLRSRSTGVPESYLVYLKGRTLLKGTTQESLADAKRQFELAVRLDPSNARAYSGLADAIYRGAQTSGRSLRNLEEVLQIARGFVSKSILLDPSAAEAHASLGYLLLELLEFAEADRELRIAISLNPSYAPAHNWYAHLLTEKGQLEDALEEMLLAEEADPLSPGIQNRLAYLLVALGRPGEATQKIAHLSELEPDGLRYHLARFEVALRSEHHPALKTETVWITGHSPVLGSERLEAAWYGKYWAAIGDLEGAQKEIARLLALRNPDTRETSDWVASELAEIYALLRDSDECFRWLEQALVDRALSFEQWWLSPNYQANRTDHRFLEILKRAKLA
jgi:TolB-like protein/Flp pilus assembly protein TadD